MSIIVEPSRPTNDNIRMLEEHKQRMFNGSSADLNDDDPMQPDIPVVNKPIFGSKKCFEESTNELDKNEDAQMEEELPGDADDLSGSQDLSDQIKRLQAELFREESKLILLKKLYHLQNPPPKPEKREEPPPVDRKGHIQNKAAAAVSASLQNGLKSSKAILESLKNDKLQGQTSKVNNLIKANQNLSSRNQNQGIADISKNLAQRAVPNKSGREAVAQVTPSSRMPSSMSSKQQQSADQMEQQMASERMNMKRQLEKTLLQVVPPKPPLPDINFIPSTAAHDFVFLIGMELAANYAIHSKNFIDQSPYSEPYLCAKCGEDVCPTWKIDKDIEVVVCESCFYTARNSVARANHVDNLKQAFQTVMEKSKEIDRGTIPVIPIVPEPVSKPAKQPRAAVSPSVFPPTTAQMVSRNRNDHSNPVVSNPYRSSAGKVNNFPQSLPVRSSLPPAPSSRSTNKPPISSPFAALATPLPFNPTAKHGPQTFGNPLQGIRMSTEDAQRQYLLDMISKTQPKAQAGQWRK